MPIATPCMLGAHRAMPQKLLWLDGRGETHLAGGCRVRAGEGDDPRRDPTAAPWMRHLPASRCGASALRTWTVERIAAASKQAIQSNGYWVPGELAKTAPDKTFAYS